MAHERELQKERDNRFSWFLLGKKERLASKEKDILEKKQSWKAMQKKKKVQQCWKTSISYQHKTITWMPARAHTPQVASAANKKGNEKDNKNKTRVTKVKTIPREQHLVVVVPSNPQHLVILSAQTIQSSCETTHNDFIRRPSCLNIAKFYVVVPSRDLGQIWGSPRLILAAMRQLSPDTKRSAPTPNTQHKAVLLKNPNTQHKRPDAKATTGPA